MKYKKSTSHILKTTEDKVKFIDELKAMYDIITLCKAVKLHHSVYYNHKQNKKIHIKKQMKNLKKLKKDMVHQKLEKY